MDETKHAVVYRGRPATLSRWQVEEIVKILQSGKRVSRSAICRHLKIRLCTLYRSAQRYGIAIPRAVVITDAALDEIEESLRANPHVNFSALSRKYRIDRRTLRKRLAERGWTFSPEAKKTP